MMKGYEITDKQEMINQLNNVNLPGCDGVLLGDAMYYQLDYLTLIKDSPKNKFRGVYWKLSIIKEMLFNKYIYKKPGKGRTFFLFSSSYGYRPDHLRAFNNVVGLFTESGYAICDYKTKKLCIRNLAMVLTINKWCKILKDKNIGASKFERTFIIKCVIDMYCEYKEAEQFFGKDFSDIHSLVCWCDIHSVDSFFTQKFNAMGKNTITLQHGVIGAADGSNRKVWTVYGVKSHYFIAHNLKTEDVLKNSGYHGTVLVAGSPYNINSEKLDNRMIANNVIGVIFAGESFHDLNVSLCKALSTMKLNIPIIAKLHPSSRIDNYDNNSLKVFSKVYGTEISSQEFLQKLVGVIILPSTVVYEALYHDIPFLFYDGKSEKYELYGMPREITIKDDIELNVKIEKMLHKEYSHIYETLSKYYTVKEDIGKNYLKALHGLNIW